MPTLYILVAKELGGVIYVTRLPKAISDNTPGIPDNWYSIGPGTNPSVQEYSGTQFVLTFNYLSHLFTRVFDIATWPPATVDPITTPPYPGTWQVELPQDALALKAQSDLAFGPVVAFLNPPILQQPTIFDNPATIPATFSATLALSGSYSPQVPPGYTPYYRLYRRTFTPTVGPWVLLPIAPATNNWQASTLSYTDSNLGSLRFQYSATLGVGFNDSDQWNPNAHNEGTVGLTYITVDSTVGHLSFQLFLAESLTADETSFLTYGDFDRRSLFIYETAFDEIQLHKPLIGQGGQVIPLFGTRGLFITAPASSDSLTIPETPGPSNFSPSTFSMGAYIGA